MSSEVIGNEDETSQNCDVVAMPGGGCGTSGHVSGWMYINQSGQMCGPYIHQQLYEAIKSGAKGLPFLKVSNDGALEGIPVLASSFDATGKDQLLKQLSASPGDLILFAVGNHASVNKTLDRLRLHVANELGLVDPSRHSILWVTDFPMFEWNDSEERLEALHHPFTAPNPDDMDDLASARALAYDMVYNGVEIGGGSLRIYKREVQEKVLEVVGIPPEQLSGDESCWMFEDE